LVFNQFLFHMKIVFVFFISKQQQQKKIFFLRSTIEPVQSIVWRWTVCRRTSVRSCTRTTRRTKRSSAKELESKMSFSRSESCSTRRRLQRTRWTTMPGSTILSSSKVSVAQTVKQRNLFFNLFCSDSFKNIGLI